MISKTNHLRYLLWTSLAGLLAGIGLLPIAPRGMILAFVLAWNLKKIYRIENGQVVGLQPGWKVFLEGLKAGLVAGVILAAISWGVYNSTPNQKTEMLLFVATPWPTLLSCLVYGGGLYLVCSLGATEAFRSRNRWERLVFILVLSSLVAMLRALFAAASTKSPELFFDVGFSAFFSGAIPFCLLWLGAVHGLDPYAQELACRNPPPIPSASARVAWNRFYSYLAVSGILSVFGMLFSLSTLTQGLGETQGRQQQKADSVLDKHAQAIAVYIKTHQAPPATLADIELPPETLQTDGRRRFVGEPSKGKDYWGFDLIYKVDREKNLLTLGSYGYDGKPGGMIDGRDADTIMVLRISSPEALEEDLKDQKWRGNPGSLLYGRQEIRHDR